MTDGTDPDHLCVCVAGPAGPVRVHVWPSSGSPSGSVDVGAGSRGGGPRARRRRDEGCRPVLLALHGWTDSGEVFGPLAAALGRRWTVVAPDAPGHGGTAWRAGPEYALDGQVPGALAVLDALPRVAGRHAPVVVLGHSTGALPAAALARARPRAVRHVVLEEPVGTGGRRPGRSQAARRRLVAGLQALPEAERIAWARRRHPGWADDEYGPWARSVGHVDLRHLGVPVEWGAALAPRVTGARQPVLLVRGVPRLGGAVTGPGAAKVVAAAPPGRVTVLALEAGHDVRREARQEFAAALAAVLSRYDH